MLTRRILTKMFATALYFGDQGARCCARTLGGRGAIIGLLIGFLDERGWSSLAGIVWRMAEGAFGCCFYAFIMGLFGGGILFFCAGLWHGVRPDFEREKEAKRRCLALQCAALYCGWAAVVTGLFVLALQGRFRYFSFSSSRSMSFIVEDCLLYLLGGNILGIALGAFSPGTVERTCGVIKTLFSSQRT